ncbi:MAG: B12-binding domain-containing radical SAM protein, partial [Candidatus Omnitrophota bacterium]|nr:B12-binding domain-containing radical SAM protein [Candidatus Omnitrophota bacterium]
SSIIGLEEHTPENIDDVIEYAVSHGTDFHQFMLYTPIPGTQLYAEHLAAGTLRGPNEYQEADVHGQFIFRHRHPHIKDGKESEFILKAFRRDFEVNGPSVLRIARTVLEGWRRYKHHADPRIQNRFAWEARDLAVTFPATLWAASRWFRERNPALVRKLSGLLDDIKREIGIKARLVAPLAGWFVWSKLRQEDQRLKTGWTYEPPTFYEANELMLRHRRHWTFPPAPIQWVSV